MLSLTYTLKQANNGRRRAVALVGDAGIGKTRIAQQLAKAAESSKFRVAWATCTSRNGRLTTWTTLVAQLIGIDPMQDTEEARAVVRECLRDLEKPELESPIIDLVFDPPPEDVPGVERPAAYDRSIFSAADALKDDQGGTGDSGVYGAAKDYMASKEDSKGINSGLFKHASQRVSVIEALIQFLQAYTQKTPTLLVIDNLHLENPQAIHVLRDVLAAIKQARLVVVITYEPTLNVELDAQTLVVPDLSEDDTYQVALAILHSTELGPRLKQLLWSRSNGRPLFIESLLRKLLQESYIDQSEGYAELSASADADALPDDVRELVISRLDTFSPQAQTVLRAASVMVEEFIFDALQAVAEMPNAPQLRTTLADMVKAQVLEKIDERTFRFRHGLTQSVIYESLARAQRLRLHRLAVNFWRGHTEYVYQPIMLAYHLVRCGLLPEAVEIVTTAAATAEQGGDIERAIELYTHSLGIFPEDHSVTIELDRLRAMLKEGESEGST
jgi:predicted ATPase